MLIPFWRRAPRRTAATPNVHAEAADGGGGESGSAHGGDGQNSIHILTTFLSSLLDRPPASHSYLPPLVTAWDQSSPFLSYRSAPQRRHTPALVITARNTIMSAEDKLNGGLHALSTVGGDSES